MVNPFLVNVSILQPQNYQEMFDFMVLSECINWNIGQKRIKSIEIQKVRGFWDLKPSGGRNPVNWLNQTRRNLTTEYLNLNIVTTPKLTLLHLFFAEKVFISCAWLITVSLVRAMDSERTTSKLFWYRYFAAYPFGFKVFNQIGNRQYFQLVENEKYFARENAKGVVDGLGTGSFATVTNLAPHSCGCGEISNNLQGLTPHVKAKWENF